jgi:predicted metalloprotease
MRIDDQEESQNIEDRRGSSGRRGRGRLSIGVIVLALVGAYFGVDPKAILQVGSQMNAGSSTSAPVAEGHAEIRAKKLVSVTLASTEKVWGNIFADSNKRYSVPRLVLFRDQTETACGRGQSATGPFYCPADKKVYIDLGFYELLSKRFGAPGDFAQAYVIAHEVGHHVQNLLGISAQVHEAQQSAKSKAQANALSVRLELQADCFAGVWASHAQQLIEPGDIEEALQAASAIGDDTLQQRSQSQIVPDSFTHGSSAQRVQWFKRGFEFGNINQCDTFSRQESR